MFFRAFFTFYHFFKKKRGAVFSFFFYLAPTLTGSLQRAFPELKNVFDAPLQKKSRTKLLVVFFVPSPILFFISCFKRRRRRRNLNPSLCFGLPDIETSQFDLTLQNMDLNERPTIDLEGRRQKLLTENIVLALLDHLKQTPSKQISSSVNL